MTQPLSIDRLVEELTAFVRNGEALLQALGDGAGDDAGDEMHAARQRAQESLAAAKQRFTQLQDSLSNEARAAVDAGEGYLRDNPWTSIALAAGIGFLVGTLLGRGRRA